MNTHNAVGFQLDATASSKEHTEMFHKMIVSKLELHPLQKY